MTTASVYILATLDTKGLEAAFVRDELVRQGVHAVLVDTGCMGTPTVAADISRAEVFRAAGSSHSAVQVRADRGEAVTLSAAGATKLLVERHAAGKVAGVLGLGGSAGTTIGSAVMRALPFGLPKVMISTHASGNTRTYVSHKDIVMFNPVVDIAGLNRITRTVLGQAAAALAGMVAGMAAGMLAAREPQGAASERPIIAATMFGVTTPCVEHARTLLENAGYEVLVFHATGAGGEAMESLIRDGVVAGVLDVTTTELADELCGGFLSAGPDRLAAAARAGIPQVISVGATDMINFHGRATVPAQFHDRLFYQHNDHVTLMRSTAADNRRIGGELARRASLSRAPTAIFLPLQGVSAIDRTGAPFDDPAARESLFAAIRAGHGDVELVELDLHINDPAFAAAMANKLLSFLPKLSTPA